MRLSERRRLVGRQAEGAVRYHSIIRLGWLRQLLEVCHLKRDAVAEPARVGSPAGTTRGFGKAEFQEIGDMVADVLDGLKAKGEEGDPAVEADVKRRVEALCDRFPIYGEQ